MDRITAIDLFAGAGGSTAGLVRAGCDVRLAVERDRSAAATYSANFPYVSLVPQAIEQYTADQILHQARLERGSLGIMSACPPCQGFSTLGNRNPGDDRNNYVNLVAALVEDLLPRAVIIENVPQLARDDRWSLLQDSLRRAGYGVNSWLVDAAAFCVPQRRRRLVLVAVLGLRDIDISDPRSTYNCEDWRRHPHTVRQVLQELGPPGDEDDLHRARKLPQQVLRRIKGIPPDGGSRCALPVRLQLECHKRMRYRHAANVYGRMRWDEPAPTMTTRCTTPACGRFLHPVDHRPVTLREAAAFQTFPPDFRWVGGAQSIARQIGNAVPVRLAHVLALHTLMLIELARARALSFSLLAAGLAQLRSPRSEPLAIPSP